MSNKDELKKIPTFNLKLKISFVSDEGVETKPVAFMDQKGISFDKIENDLIPMLRTAHEKLVQYEEYLQTLPEESFKEIVNTPMTEDTVYDVVTVEKEPETLN